MGIMRRGQGPAGPVYLPLWEYLGGEVIEGTAVNVEATLPTNTTIFQINAEAGDIQYQINHVCPAAGAGFVPENGARIHGPLQNLRELHVNMAVGVTAHIQYFREYFK